MTMEDGSCPSPVTPSEAEAGAEDYESWTLKQKIEDLVNCDPIHGIVPKNPKYKAYFEEKFQEKLSKYVRVVLPKLRPAIQKDSVKQFFQVYNCWVALQGTSPLLRRRRADPNTRHRYGFAPLHMAAENFSVDMVKLLFRYGASANICTKGEYVIEGLLPLHVAVENASMHKYIEDHWAHGDHIINLIFLLCLPEMKMFLDTTRLIAKQTDNIVDEVWNYIREEKHVQAAILLLAAQKQLRGRLNNSSGKASLNGFDIVKSHIDDALNTIHLEGLNMVKEGKNGRALKRLKDKKEALLTALVLVGIVHKAGEALEGYIQTHSQVRHDEIVEHVSSILKSNGIAHSGESIDTGKLECYQHGGGMSIGKSDSQRVGYGETIEADKSSSDIGEVSKMILGKQPPKGSAIREVRDMFFPYWKSVLSRRLQLKIVPSCQLSRKDLLSAEASTKGTKSMDHPCNPIKSMGNLGSMGWPPLSSESRRMLYTVASMSRKVFKRT
ncbi:uncharacterized protein [Oryza sativa Japonica Group]|uniref:uncharacterized protein isoform X2 n=1 Tax=Oryza sativa subsp. japonica TaxID=39947 RepID=UPI0001C7A5C1|nr:uncharacterized protein LOC4351344 isoform X2 [Oryza sativa Japonica Group]